MFWLGSKAGMISFSLKKKNLIKSKLKNKKMKLEHFSNVISNLSIKMGINKISSTSRNFHTRTKDF